MKTLLSFSLMLCLAGCYTSVANNPDSRPPDHSLYDELLKKYVDDAGLVDYAALKKNRPQLRRYLSTLELNAPNESWSRDEKLAYWINAYNAYTLDLIIQHYPIKSIKDLGSIIKIPLISTAWNIKFIEIEGQKYDLDNIEHGIIRKRFNEPRIHFALVCAAVSCPKLRNEAFTAEKLDDQLSMAARDFLSDKSKNNISMSKSAQLSKIFSWYGGDFKKNGTLVDYLNQYAPVQLDSRAEIKYMDYNWNLNEQKSNP